MRTDQGGIDVFDGALGSDVEDEIESLLLSNEFPWFFQPRTLYETQPPAPESNEIVDFPFFSHVFVAPIGRNNSAHCDRILALFNPFFNQIGARSVLRARANMFTESKNKKANAHTPYHVDLDVPHKVVLYYANDSTGETVFESGDEIAPKRGRVIVFDGSLFHGLRGPSEGVRIGLVFNIT